MASPKAEDRSRIWRALGGVGLESAPYVFSLAAFLGGLTVLLSAAMPSIAERIGMLRGAPIVLIEFSHFAASLVGVLLMLMASSLWRRREGAYWLTLILLLVGSAVSLTKGLEYEPALFLAGCAAVMAPFRPAFDRPSRLFSARPGSVWLIATVAAVASAGALGFFAYRNVAYTDDLWWTFMRDGDASRFLRAGVAVAILTFAAAILALCSGPRQWRGHPSAEDIARAAAILQTAEYAAPDSGLALAGDGDLLFSDSGRSFLMFRVRGAHWIVKGEPAGLISERRELMWKFAEMADRSGGWPVFYGVCGEMLPSLASMGFVILQVGEAAVVDTAAFSLTGKAKQDQRTARNRAQAEGAVFEVLPPGSATPNLAELKTVSDAWLKRQAGGEKSFTMGRFDPAYLDRTPLAVVRLGGRIVAFANLLVVADRSSAAIDLMRFNDAAPPGVMDFLFVELIEWAKAEGYAEFSLGSAPLSGLENRRIAPLFNRMGALVFAEAGALYGFEGLRAYKAKFATAWRPVYIAGRLGVVMPMALMDVALLTSGGWRGLIAKD